MHRVLPDDALARIFGWLTLEELLCRANLVCKQFMRVILVDVQVLPMITRVPRSVFMHSFGDRIQVVDVDGAMPPMCGDQLTHYRATKRIGSLFNGAVPALKSLQVPSLLDGDADMIGWDSMEALALTNCRAIAPTEFSNVCTRVASSDIKSICLGNLDSAKSAALCAGAVQTNVNRLRMTYLPHRANHKFARTFPNLLSAEFKSCALRDEDMLEVGLWGSGLTTLTLADTLLTSTGICNMISQMKELQDLTIHESSSIEPADFKRLLVDTASCPKLTTLRCSWSIYGFLCAQNEILSARRTLRLECIGKS